VVVANGRDPAQRAGRIKPVRRGGVRATSDGVQAGLAPGGKREANPGTPPIQSPPWAPVAKSAAMSPPWIVFMVALGLQVDQGRTTFLVQRARLLLQHPWSEHSARYSGQRLWQAISKILT
jgi:hypothetical protein